VVNKTNKSRSHTVLEHLVSLLTDPDSTALRGAVGRTPQSTPASLVANVGSCGRKGGVVVGKGGVSRKREL